MNLNISYSVDFVKERTEKTRAVQAVIATGGGWVWPKKTLAQWDASGAAGRGGDGDAGAGGGGGECGVPGFAGEAG